MVLQKQVIGVNRAKPVKRRRIFQEIRLLHQPKLSNICSTNNFSTPKEEGKLSKNLATLEKDDTMQRIEEDGGS